MTVDDDVNVTASTSPARTRSSASGRASTATVRYTGEHVDRVARGRAALRAARRAPARPGRAAPARPRAAGRGTPRAATRRRTARARGRRARRGARARRRVPGRSRRPQRRRARGRRGRPAPSPRSKNASTPFADVNTSHAYSVERRELRTRRGSIAIDGSSTTSAPSASSRRAQLARLLARPGDDDACGRTAGAARTSRGRARRPRRRRSPTAAATPASAIVASVARTRPLVGAGAAAHRGDRRVRRAAAVDRAAPAMSRDAARAHQDHERAAGAARARPSRRRSCPWPGPRGR